MEQNGAKAGPFANEPDAPAFGSIQTPDSPLVSWFVSMAERMAGLQNRLIDLLAGGIEAQLASILLREADDSGRVQTTQGTLASMLGVQRSSVQRVLKHLETAQLIELHYRHIDLIDRGGLVSLLEDSEAKPPARAPHSPG